MARSDSALIPKLSLLDRLVDESPESRQEPLRSRTQILTDLRNFARRDLEILLNTRRRCIGWPNFYDALNDSLLNYGIPDFTAENMSTPQRRESFRRSVEDAIRRFEPRFTRVSVQLVESENQLERTLRFRVEAVMQCDPEPESIVFDTILDPASRVFAVRPVSGNA